MGHPTQGQPLRQVSGIISEPRIPPEFIGFFMGLFGNRGNRIEYEMEFVLDCGHAIEETVKGYTNALQKEQNIWMRCPYCKVK